MVMRRMTADSAAATRPAPAMLLGRLIARFDFLLLWWRRTCRGQLAQRIRKPLIREFLRDRRLAPVRSHHRLGEIGLRRIRQRLDGRSRHTRAPELGLWRFHLPEEEKRRPPATGHRNRGLGEAWRLRTQIIQLEAV